MPEAWRQGKELPTDQGIILGCTGRKNEVTALVDTDDVHCLMIGASGVGKTAFFLYPNLEYACATGMCAGTRGKRVDRTRRLARMAVVAQAPSPSGTCHAVPMFMLVATGGSGDTPHPPAHDPPR